VADTDQAERPFYARSWALDGIEILRSGKGGDGRTVEAYATPFDVLTEISDRHGHYNERIHRSAFDRQLGRGLAGIGVYYHHGLTLHGTPSDLGSVPIGSPVEIRPDGRGLRTVTRYNTTPLADAVLAAIDNGDIRGYSFRGPIYKSNPERIPKARPGASGSALPTVTRMALGLIEYGPTPTPAYADASIVAVRSMIEQALASTPLRLGGDQEMPLAPPDRDQAAEDQPPSAGPSVRHQLLRLRAAVRDRGI